MLLAATLVRHVGAVPGRQSAVLVAAILPPTCSTSCSTGGRGAVPAGRPDPVRLRADHRGPGLGVYQFSLLDLRPGGPQPDLPDDQRPGPGARPTQALIANPAVVGWSASRRPRSLASRSPSFPPSWSATVTAAMAAGSTRPARRSTGTAASTTCHLRPARPPVPARRAPGRARTSPSGARSRRPAVRRPQPRAGGHRPAGGRAGARAAAAEHLRTLDELKSGFLQPSPTTCAPRCSCCISLTLQQDGAGWRRPTPTTSSAGSSPTPGGTDPHRPARPRQADRGIVELRRERVDLDWLVAGVVSEARDELLDAHPVSLAELLPVQVVADAAKVERTSRTCSPTPPAIPTRARPSGSGRPSAGGAAVRRGRRPGIPAEQREPIFRPFQRGPGDTTFTS